MQRVGVRCRNLDDAAIGALVTEVQSGSPASAAGLAAGNVIVSVNGHACCSYAHAERLLAESAAPSECVVWYPNGPPRYIVMPPITARGVSSYEAGWRSDDPSHYDDEAACMEIS